jgi:hypothetical protein
MANISILQISIKRKRQSAAFSQYMETALLKDIPVLPPHRAGNMIGKELFKSSDMSYLLIVWWDYNSGHLLDLLQEIEQLMQFEPKMTSMGLYATVEKAENTEGEIS